MAGADGLVERALLPVVLGNHPTDHDGLVASSLQRRQMRRQKSRQQIHVVVDDADPRRVGPHDGAMTRHGLPRVLLELVAKREGDVLPGAIEHAAILRLGFVDAVDDGRDFEIRWRQRLLLQ